MRVRITSEARALGLHHPRVWRITSMSPLMDEAGLTAEQVGAAYDVSAALPNGYRELLKNLGHPEVVPAGERLREVLARRGWKSHGAVVDAVSVATLRHGAGIGLHRWLPTDEGRTLFITRADGTERITPAFTTRSRPVPAGDLVYGAETPDGGRELFAWLGRRDCDAADRQLTADDREALLVVLGCPGEGSSHTQEIGATIVETLTSLRPDVTVAEVPVECGSLVEG